MSSSIISVDEVRRVAKLARIKLTPTEETTFAGQLSLVLEHINNLNRLNTDDVIPTSQVTNLKNVFQTAPNKCFTQAEAVSSAAKTSNGYFEVPQSIDK
jgi:aspartyl-tRNA(Asn)/glutamyl-tRNA(Gln) amidotransferase subunit C